MKPGDIYWIELPASPNSQQAGRRPAVVLQDDRQAGFPPTIVVVPLTGSIEALKYTCTVSLLPDAENALKKPSVILVFQIRALDRSQVRGYIGTVTAEKLAEIYESLGTLLGCTCSPVESQG